ncbi:type IV secretory system conjugative DNA transfer family protein [Mycobacterium sp. DSM 3803]|nr:type IV secretory system conjugative DNA transfer family protein [Mycobacterium sp. DSM 3803]OKH75604.1 type VI secretion protein [Mycobacterium sp. SWH-M3]
MYVKPATPYCGFGKRRVGGGGEELFVPRSASHCLISAPTETGKTRRLLAPQCTLWGGPVVCVSSKDDLMQLVMERRWGPKALIDLRPMAMDPVYPDGVEKLSYDPTMNIFTPNEALTVAETIMQMATVGLGSGADQVSDGGIWESQAAGPLAALLYAASPCGNNEGITWVLKAVDNLDPESMNSPGWAQAAALCRNFEVLALGMLRILDMEPRQRDSVAITMRKAIMPWLRTTLGVNLSVPFDPRFLDDPMATLFVLAPADGTVAGSAVTLLDSLVRRWRDKTSSHQQMERLLIVVDELPNTAPIPALRRIVGEGRGLGINFVAAVQASSQLDTVYGSTYANELRDIFPACVIMVGAREEELLTAAEHWSGWTTRFSENFSQADGHKTLSPELGPGLRWQELLPTDRDFARLLLRGGVGSLVEIPDWLVFRERYDAQVKLLLQGRQPPGDPARWRLIMRELLHRWADPTPD